jgi:hypothetical protein
VENKKKEDEKKLKDLKVEVEKDTLKDCKNDKIMFNQLDKIKFVDQIDLKVEEKMIEEPSSLEYNPESTYNPNCF